MKITVLLENTTKDKRLKTKHGLSLYISTQKHTLLFDLGPGKQFLKNAETLGIDVSEADAAIISHGHDDHGGGLKAFLSANSKATVYVRQSAFLPHYERGMKFANNIGLDRKLIKHPRILYTGEWFTIDDELQVFSGAANDELRPSNDGLFVETKSGMANGPFIHEQSLIISEGDKRVLIGGCAHNGIAGILEKAELILGGEKITHVVSGMHLASPADKLIESEDYINRLASKLNESSAQFYTCHCTGLSGYEKLSETMHDKIQYLAAGESIEI